MTLEQKLSYIGGTGFFDLKSIPLVAHFPGRLNPQIYQTDAGLGVRRNHPSVRFPSGLTLAATWNPTLAYNQGVAMGQDTRARGYFALEAPGMDFYRVPLGGRNFEYLTGEDPFLGSQLAPQEVLGIQSQGVWACAKHYVCNDEEENRTNVNIRIDKRVLREIYLPPFEASVKVGHAATVMGAYNKVNGDWCCESSFLLQDILKRDWGFPGILVSDYLAIHNGVKAAAAGCDVDLPDGRFMNNTTLGPVIGAGLLPVSFIDDKVRRILRGVISFGSLDRQQLDPTIPAANQSSFSVRWTGQIRPSISGDHVFKLRADGGMRLYVNGQKVIDTLNSPLLPVVGYGPTPARSGRINLQAGKTYAVVIEYRRVSGFFNYFEEGGLQGVQASWASLQAPPDLAKYDAVVVSGGISEEFEGEGRDRAFSLPEFQDELIQNLSRANPRTIVVLHGGGNFDSLGWINQVGAYLHTFYPGQNGGQALAEILFGDVNPSGRLPVTFERRIEDNPAYATFPKPVNQLPTEIAYSEGLDVGYRGYEKRHITPLYPFGYGLSYTTFGFSDIKLEPSVFDGTSPVKVTFSVTNTGQRAGAEVAQLYVGQENPTIDRPLKELKGFEKVYLQPGESKTVTLDLNQRALAYWDEGDRKWIALPGTYKVQVGDSSQDIKLNARFSLADKLTANP